MGLPVRERRAARAPQRDGALRRRHRQRRDLGARSPTWAAAPSRTRAACTWPPCETAPQTFEHVDPAVVGNEQRILISRALGQGRRAAQGAGAGPRSSRATTSASPPCSSASRTASTSGYHYEAADASFELLLRERAGAARAAVPPRELPRDRREARGRQGGRRGDHQGARRRRAHHQHRRGQRPGQRARHGAAPGDHAQVPAPRRHRARQLQGAHPRRDQGHRRRHARAARRQRRRGRAGAASACSENIIEASWEALVDSIEYGMLEARSEE